MTLEEMLAREGIRKTMASYTVAGDRLRAEDFMAVFTEDAIVESEAVGESDTFRYEGREALREWIARWRTRLSGHNRHRKRPSCVIIFRHRTSRSSTRITPEARTYWVAYTDIGPDHCGYYLDVFRKVGDEWLIAHRKVRLDWRAPESLFKTAVARTR